MSVVLLLYFNTIIFQQLQFNHHLGIDLAYERADLSETTTTRIVTITAALHELCMLFLDYSISCNILT